MPLFSKGKVDSDFSAVNFLTVHVFDGFAGGFHGFVGDEAETSGGVGFAVPDEDDVVDFAMGGEVF